MSSIPRANTIKRGVQVVLILSILLFSLGLGNTQVVYAAPPSNNNFANAKTVGSIPYTDNLATTEATVEANEPPVPPAGIQCENKSLRRGNNTVWYKYTPGTSGVISFDTTGSDYDTYIAVWTGTALNNLTLIGCDDDQSADLTSQLSINATAGVAYYIQVAKYNGTITGSTEPACSLNGNTCNLTFNVKKHTFLDVPPTYWAWQFVERLYNAGITGGCTVQPLNYCPEGLVTRAQMAVFLLRGIHGASYNPPSVGGSTGFADVPTNYWAAAWIKQLAAEGITGGCGGSNYCPEAFVTRAQMAVFLLRSKYGSSYSPPSVGGSTGFADVQTNYWAAAWIKQLVAEGITSGCGGSNYCPEASVTRAQMAVFLVRTFNLP